MYTAFNTGGLLVMKLEPLLKAASINYAPCSYQPIKLSKHTTTYWLLL